MNTGSRLAAKYFFALSFHPLTLGRGSIFFTHLKLAVVSSVDFICCKHDLKCLPDFIVGGI
jgi:hypothetical protein